MSRILLSLISGGIPTIIFILKSLWDNRQVKALWAEINEHINLDHGSDWEQLKEEVPKVLCNFCGDTKKVEMIGRNDSTVTMDCPACTNKPGMCTCIERNHPAFATTTVQDCKEHGMSPMHTNAAYAKSGVPVPHCDEHEIPMHQECLKSGASFHNVRIPTTNPAISYSGGSYPPAELQDMSPVSKYPPELVGDNSEPADSGERSYLFRDQEK